jgi:hypothetical protein
MDGLERYVWAIKIDISCVDTNPKSTTPTPAFSGRHFLWPLPLAMALRQLSVFKGIHELSTSRLCTNFIPSAAPEWCAVDGVVPVQHLWMLENVRYVAAARPMDCALNTDLFYKKQRDIFRMGEERDRNHIIENNEDEVKRGVKITNTPRRTLNTECMWKDMPSDHLFTLPTELLESIFGGRATDLVSCPIWNSKMEWMAMRGVSRMFRKFADDAAIHWVNLSRKMWTQAVASRRVVDALKVRAHVVGAGIDLFELEKNFDFADTQRNSLDTFFRLISGHCPLSTPPRVFSRMMRTLQTASKHKRQKTRQGAYTERAVRVRLMVPDARVSELKESGWVFVNGLQ